MKIEKLSMAVASLGVLPGVQAFANAAKLFTELCILSGRSSEEIKRHLSTYPGSIRDLKAFYQRWGKFPCEFAEEHSNNDTATALLALEGGCCAD